MLLNQLQQLLGDLRTRVLRRNIEYQVGGCAVKRITLLIELLQLGKWIVYLKEGTVFIARNAPV